MELRLVVLLTFSHLRWVAGTYQQGVAAAPA
jgi:hypothetical protein